MSFRSCFLFGSAAILQYLAELADSNKLGQGGNKYCGEPAEKAVILGLSLMVSLLV
jgi:glutathione S-transferase